MSDETSWHALTVEEVTRTTDVDTERGLGDDAVAKRRAQFGENRLDPPKQTSALMRFMLQFHQPLVYILLGACAVTLVLQEWADASVIFGVVIINAIVGYVQEAKAINALNALKGSMSSKALVIRNGEKRNVAAEALVPGDIVILGAGDRIPADVRLIRCKDMKADESALTGESLPSEKTVDPVSKDASLGDRHNIGFSSTLVTYGAGRGIVIATGKHTEIGKISTLLNETETLDTPLTQRIKEFSHILLYAIIGLAGITFVAGWLHGNTLVDAFMAAVALAVGAIPEGLPAAVTIMLAIGVSRMAKRNAIIRQLPAVETLGSTTVICSDKTGTLTKNEMTVREIWCHGEHFDVSGTGYNPQGEISQNGEAVLDENNVALTALLQAGASCNDADINAPDEPSGNWQMTGDPTEAALLVSARKGHIDQSGLPPRTDEIPFQSETKYMATLHAQGDESVIYMKGSVESVLNRCQFDDLNITKATVNEAAEAMAKKGLRVLAFARKIPDVSTPAFTADTLGNNMQFLGLQGMIDPPRDEAITAAAQCRQAGVTVKMITGDHVITATAIAENLGIVSPEDKDITHTGVQLDSYSDEEFDRAALTGKVFARVSPQNKLALVTSLQKQRQVVAMTGDGVNDAPALRRADVGVAMALNGTEVARDAADMMLTDDNFATVTAAVEEGRGIYDNLKKFIVWTLPTNGGEALVVLFAVALGIALPLLPIHILLA